MAEASGLIRRPRTGKEILGRLFLRAIFAFMVTTVVLYCCDYLILRYRVATKKSPYGSVTVRPYYAVARKDHRTEFMPADPSDQQCVNSLFPHMGDSPCWYLSRHSEPEINM